MNKTKTISISLAFPYDVVPKEDKFEAIVAGFDKMSATSKTEYLAKEELRYILKSYIQSAINKGIPLPRFLEVR